MLSSLRAGASAGMTMIVAISRRLPACAIPCAWFPGEYAITPCARTAGSWDDSAFQAPRNLNEPVRCRDSALTSTRRPASAFRCGLSSSGVRLATVSSQVAARRMAAMSIGSAFGIACKGRVAAFIAYLLRQRARIMIMSASSSGVSHTWPISLDTGPQAAVGPELCTALSRTSIPQPRHPPWPSSDFRTSISRLATSPC